jgi:hypothetical protein
VGERVEPVLIRARADDLTIELGRAVEVVVVVVQAGGINLLASTPVSKWADCGQ